MDWVLHSLRQIWHQFDIHIVIKIHCCRMIWGLINIQSEDGLKVKQTLNEDCCFLWYITSGYIFSFEEYTLLDWRWKHRFAPKHIDLSTKLNGIISQKTIMMKPHCQHFLVCYFVPCHFFLSWRGKTHKSLENMTHTMYVEDKRHLLTLNQL